MKASEILNEIKLFYLKETKTMKHFFLFFLIAIIALTACPPPDPVPPQVQPTPIPIAPPVQLDAVKFALYDGTTLRLWDGLNLVDAYSGEIHHAGFRKLSIENVLYYFDDYGKSEYSLWINMIPDAITTVSKELNSRATISYEDDIYTLEHITPQEAYDMGAMARDYTRVYENGMEVGNWYLNEWIVDHVITTSSGHIVAIDTLKRYHNLTDNKIVETAYQDGIMLHDVSTQHGWITDNTGTYEITWQYNFFDHSVWQEADGVWYTENGYTWSSETGVVSNANSMYCWNSWETYPTSYDVTYGERPYLLPAGVRTENEIEVTYWLETVTGQVYRHIPSIDNYQVVSEIYEGPGTRMEAIPYYNTLKPELIENKIYFHEGGMIRTFNLDNLLVEIFIGDMELIPWN